MTEPTATRRRVTAPAITAGKGGDPLVMVTAYDAPTARIVDAAGVDMILVGDSVAMVVLGYEDTLQVTTADLEGFLGHSPGNRHQRTYVLRGFFGWAKHRMLILIDPATALRLGSQPAFTGTVLDAAAQRALFRRWTGSTAHPHERLTGLLALLHAASSAQIRGLTLCRQTRVSQLVTDLDPKLAATALGMRTP